MPPPLPVAPTPPLPAPYVRDGDTRGHTPGLTLPHSRGRGVHEGMPPPALPFSWATPARTRGMEACEGATPGPPPFPIRAEGGRARACRPLSLLPPTPPLPAPSARGTRGHATPASTLPHSRGKGARRHAAPGTSPPPLGRATPCARDGGTRGHDAPGCPVRAGTPHPGPPFPIRAEGGAPSACRPVRAEQGHASARRPRPRLPSCPRHPVQRGKGACEGKPPHPVTPRSRGNGRTRPSRVEQQDRRGLRAPAFTAPAPRLRGIVRLRQKIDVA
ncbi:hypothetical protein EDB84DRAFT_1573014 [Lactarius hengduanensis]|nr:hypothetical protein EDB84DRAFT_1573014 [Lactarius hengduanensis]